MSSNCTYFRHFSFIEKQFAIITLALNEGLETYHNLCYYQEKLILRYKVNKICIKSILENYKTLMKEIKENINEWKEVWVLMDIRGQYCY